MLSLNQLLTTDLPPLSWSLLYGSSGGPIKLAFEGKEGDHVATFIFSKCLIARDTHQLSKEQDDQQ